MSNNFICPSCPNSLICSERGVFKEPDYADKVTDCKHHPVNLVKRISQAALNIEQEIMSDPYRIMRSE